MTSRPTKSENELHAELPQPFRGAVEQILSEPVPQVDLSRIRSRLAGGTEPRPARRAPIRWLRQLSFAAAAAAVVVTAVFRWPHPSNAWAQAIQQVREARTLTYTQLLTIKGQEQPAQTRNFIAADGRKRTEQAGIGKSKGVTTIFGADSYIRITLIEDSKTAIVPDLPDQRPGAKVGAGFLAWLENLKKAGDKPDKELGQKTLDGIQVSGFVATLGNFTYTMWVDTATKKLVRIEYESQIKGTGYDAVVMTDFRFDEKLDESLFSFDVPEGYKIQPKQPAVPSVPGGEKSIVEALRGYTSRTDGKFPASIADWGPWVLLVSKDSRDGKLDPEAMSMLAHLGAITAFLSSMRKDDYSYLGEGQTVEQKDAIIFWYKKPDKTYRAIYGDLSVKDITAEELPKK
jgi:hypothetical protein